MFQDVFLTRLELSYHTENKFAIPFLVYISIFIEVIYRNVAYYFKKHLNDAKTKINISPSFSIK